MLVGDVLEEIEHHDVVEGPAEGDDVARVHRAKWKMARLRTSPIDEIDLQQLIAAGSRIRVVKGGYWEDPATVYRAKAEIDAAFGRDVRLLLERGVAPAIATHDPAAIAAARTIATEQGRSQADFEFQMLYGVRPDLQEALVREGYQVRLYVPYGGDWFIYFLGCVRRLPAGFIRRFRTRVRRSRSSTRQRPGRAG